MLHLTMAREPYTAEQFIGQPGWAVLLPSDAIHLQAAIFRVMRSGKPEWIDVDIDHVGRWRLHLYACRIGKARIFGMAEEIPQSVLSLTDRQRQICRLLAAGHASKEIGAKLSVTRGTVDNHRAQIAEKIGIPPRQLVAWCGEHKRWL